MRIGPRRPGAAALPEHARSHNRTLVLQALYRGQGLSRADLAREVGLTRVTISDVVADLIDENLVIELGPRADARPGKPATVLDLNRTGFAIVAVDLSHHNLFRGILADLDGAIAQRMELSAAGLTGQQAVDAVHTIVTDLLQRASVPVIGIAIGTPGLVDLEGTVLSAPNLGWTDLPLQRLLIERHSVPVQVANDANMAVVGERTFGGAGADTMLVRIGRGVGSGIVVGGHLVYGSGFAAGEIGHVVVGTDGGEPCACGKHGCLETWIAAPHVEARLAATNDDAARAAVLTAAGERLGIALGPVVGALNLSEVVLAGPIDIVDGPLLAGVSDTLRQRTMGELHGDLALRMTTLGRDIVVLGGVVMVLTGQLGVS